MSWLLWLAAVNIVYLATALVVLHNFPKFRSSDYLGRMAAAYLLPALGEGIVLFALCAGAYELSAVLKTRWRDSQHGQATPIS